MEKDMGEYVAACPICSRNKSSSHSLAGLLQPLLVPQCPWSDITLDFIAGLPHSEGTTIVLTVVDIFSKMIHFIPMPKLPKAKETAEALLKNVFFYICMVSHRDVVSDRKPQFISRFKGALISLIRPTVSLTSAYFPQSNGQMER